jgi:uncharacterized protein (TIGR02118 family)
MVRINILYPNTGRFDMDYYLNTHMPMSIAKLAAHRGFKGVSVESGLGGAEPGSPPAFVALCHFLFDSAEDFMEAFAPHAAVLQGDMRNYTDIEPVIQVSEVAISK